MRVTDVKHRRVKSFVALWLTFVAGFVDVVGFLTIYRLFTAHMTGTTVRIAEEIMRHNWQKAAIASAVVGAFFTGSVAGRIFIEIGSRSRVRRIATVTLAIEAALLAGCVPLGINAPHNESAATITYVLLAMLASAMGLQTATLTGVGPLTVHTTFVTGMLNKLAQLVARMLFRTYDLNRGSSLRDEHWQKRQAHIREARFIFSIWLLYLLGAAAGTLGAVHWQIRALYLPSGILLLIIAVDQKWPLSIEEEQQE